MSVQLITPMIALSSCIVTCLALSTAAATCCWCWAYTFTHTYRQRERKTDTETETQVQEERQARGHHSPSLQNSQTFPSTAITNIMRNQHSQL